MRKRRVDLILITMVDYYKGISQGLSINDLAMYAKGKIKEIQKSEAEKIENYLNSLYYGEVKNLSQELLQKRKLIQQNLYDIVIKKLNEYVEGVLQLGFRDEGKIEIDKAINQQEFSIESISVVKFDTKSKIYLRSLKNAIKFVSSIILSMRKMYKKNQKVQDIIAEIDKTINDLSIIVKNLYGSYNGDKIIALKDHIATGKKNDIGYRFNRAIIELNSLIAEAPIISCINTIDNIEINGIIGEYSFQLPFSQLEQSASNSIINEFIESIVKGEVRERSRQDESYMIDILQKDKVNIQTKQNDKTKKISIFLGEDMSYNITNAYINSVQTKTDVTVNFYDSEEKRSLLQTLDASVKNWATLDTKNNEFNYFGQASLDQTMLRIVLLEKTIGYGFGLATTVKTEKIKELHNYAKMCILLDVVVGLGRPNYSNILVTNIRDQKKFKVYSITDIIEHYMTTEIPTRGYENSKIEMALKRNLISIQGSKNYNTLFYYSILKTLNDFKVSINEKKLEEQLG